MDKPTPQTEEKFDINAELAAAFDEQSTLPEPEPVREDDEPETEVDLDDGEPASIEAREEDEEGDETAKEVAQSEEAAAEAQQAEDSEYSEPAPERWPDEMQEAYNNMPPDQRKMFMENVFKPMQRQYTKATQELSEIRKTLEPLMEVMRSYQGDFEDVAPAELLRNQLAWAAHIRKVGPEKGLADMASAFGVKAGKGGQEDSEEYLTPTERKLTQQLAEMTEKLQGVERTTQSVTQATQQEFVNRQIAAVRYGISEFANEQKDGKPAHPHIKRVAPTIVGLINGGVVSRTDEYGQPRTIQDVLKEAYRKACDLDPSIRSASNDQRQVRNAQAAQEATVVTNEPAGEPEVPDDFDLDDALEAEYERLARKSA